MKKIVILRVVVTLFVVALAAVAGQRLWAHYEEEPWTRDGRIRADVVQVAPDVSGLVTAVLVKDNQQVSAGTPLFEIDRPRYRLAVAQAASAVAAQQVQLAQARREAARNQELGELVAGEVREQGLARVAQLEASLAQARVALDTAKLNLSRTLVRASVAGTVTNLTLRPGDYATAGHPEFAVIDRSSLHIIGYFEETKLPRIHVGDPVRVQLMGDDRVIQGHVQSVAGGIEDRDRSPGANLLANVNPTFSWVRLAQRIPVRVAIDQAPAGAELVVGRTATVEIVAPAKPGAHA
ncbi:MAG: efflux RND transporter periplasmic adaptor subunit [Sphingomonas sp.]|uniref:efflux RND transporter periplasmic adaptor subunit n=1 Tax=Sphingomonas sp. TaxID=28214 RepID=UPI001B01916F|nr:efflux RND transporter periplasmic adaptor subunit [Sphingomonas sp.]MBO9623338.1 efflux RND transporter periplasmic adaptor subunit [Sphingomonas sp.]